MSHLEFSIKHKPENQQSVEIVIAHLLNLGFNGFQEEQKGALKAFIAKEELNWNLFREALNGLKSIGIEITHSYVETDDQIWNEEWEKNYYPVNINGEVLVRAPFHSDENDLPCTLIIEPKMSFGTGHHITTRLMIGAMMKVDLSRKRVLDMGCGTAILGIYASKMNADYVIGVDIDNWAYENAIENIARNGIENMEVRLGDISVLSGEEFNVILANINRNVLVRDIPVYVKLLKPGGDMILSGFLTEDVQYVLDCAYANYLVHTSTTEEAGWLILSFKYG